MNKRYAMGGSPFEQLGEDAPGQPVEDVGDLIDARDRFNRMLHSPDLMTDQQLQGNPSGLPPRTFYGGAPARLGTEAGNRFYEKQNNLNPGTLKPSNAGRGDVVPMPSREADMRNLERWDSDPTLEDKMDAAKERLSDDEFGKFLKLFYDPRPSRLDSSQTDFDPSGLPEKAFGGRTYAFGGSPFGSHPFNVERAASIGLQREGFLNSGVAGRTDHIGLQVRNGSYVIPADVVSAAGQGNSLAGAKAFDSLLKQGPYDTARPSIQASRPMMPSMRMGNTMRMPNNLGRMNTSGFGSQKSTGIPGFGGGSPFADGGEAEDSSNPSLIQSRINQIVYDRGLTRKALGDPTWVNPQYENELQGLRLQLKGKASGGGVSPFAYGGKSITNELLTEGARGYEGGANRTPVPGWVQDQQDTRDFRNGLSPDDKREQFNRDIMNHIYNNNINPGVTRGISPEDKFWMIKQQQRWLNGQDFQEYVSGGNVTDMPKNTTDVPKNVPPARNNWGPGPWEHADEAASGGAQKKPRELVAPKEGAWNGMSAGGVSHPGADQGIPILAAGGEYIVKPETVARIGGGDQQKGFRILDKLVLLTRKKHIDTLRKLKPPKKK